MEPGSDSSGCGGGVDEAGRGTSGVTYASGWVARLEAVVSGLVSSAVLAGAVPTGPRSAEALSMPGLSPAACPPEGGGGGENGSAGLAKLVTPGAADGAMVCTGGLVGMAGLEGVSAAAAAGGANIPSAGGADCGIDGATGAWDCTAASGDTPEVLLLVFGDDNDDCPDREPACDAPEVAGEIAEVAACPVALITADIIDIPEFDATSAAAIAGAATEPPASDGNADRLDNAAPNASNPAPYRKPADALLGHMNPKYSPSKSISRGVNAPNTNGLIALSTPHSPRLASA